MSLSFLSSSLLSVTLREVPSYGRDQHLPWITTSVLSNGPLQVRFACYGAEQLYDIYKPLPGQLNFVYRS